MKKIISHLKGHVRQDFNGKIYGLTFLFLAACIYFNYQVDFEDSIIDTYTGQPIHLLWKYLFFAFAYFGANSILIIAGKRKHYNDPQFWIYSLFGLAVIALDTGSPLALWISQEVPGELTYFVYKVFRNLSNLVTVFLPLLIFYKFYERSADHFYGLGATKVNFKPYFAFLAIMLPLIVWASFQPDFLNTYPSYRANHAYRYLEVPEWFTVGIFEIAYGLDFISVEVLFRGFFVIAMAKIIGKDALLPMVVTYAFLHFGKPLGETIGSIFGGYILGIIALYSNSIWGGIVVHLGVAWLMEVAAFLQQ